MLAEKNKLSLALMIESHLPDLGEALFKKAGKAAPKDADLKKHRDAARTSENGCFVCERVAGFMGHYYSNIIYLWRKETDFREKFNRQPYFCLPHYAGLLEASQRGLPKKEQAEFVREASGVCGAYQASLKEDISEFCRSFDYRNAGRGLSEGAQTAVERAAAFLTGSRN
jgi:hypothetical protein